MRIFNIDLNSNTIGESSRTTKIFICVVTFFILIFVSLLVWTTNSRISNINSSLNVALEKETKYQIESEDTQAFKLHKLGKNNVLIYNEQIPDNLVEVKDKNSSNYIYAISDKSQIVNFKKEAEKGLKWDLVLIIFFIIVICSTFICYYKHLIDYYNKIKKQISAFCETFANCKKIDDFEKQYDTIGKKIEKIDYVGNIWWEFCETLIVKREDSEDANPNAFHSENSPIETIRNTEQVEVYINTENIINKQILNLKFLILSREY